MLATAAILIVASIQASTQTPGAVPPEERAILMELFAATGGPRWTNHNGWGSAGTSCEWYGVACDFVGGDINRPYVIGLSLPSNNLEGALPSSLSKLEHLRSVDVSQNHLSGTVPETWLQRWDAHQFEFDGSGNAFRQFVVRATVDYSSSVLCAEHGDVWFRAELDEIRNKAVLQSVRCAAAPPSRETYCLVRESASLLSLERFSRGLGALDFIHLGATYDYPFSGATHGLYLTTTAVWGDGVKKSVRTYSREGPLRAWESQQLFLGLLSDTSWEREWRKPKCDFQK
jgi:hypothetical protein